MKTAKEKNDKAASIMDGIRGWATVDQLDLLASIYCAIASIVYESASNKEEVYQALCLRLDAIKKIVREYNKFVGQ